MTKIAIVRISGEHGLTKEIKTTFKLLNLHKKYTCVIVPNSPEVIGMLKRIKDYTTWGELNKETISMILEKRGRIHGNQPLTKEYVKEKTKLEFDQLIEEINSDKKKIKDVPGLKSFFRLTPPRGGFERKGTKKPFSIGGVLGYRKEKINDLVKRML